jgi:hypothetical protein
MNLRSVPLLLSLLLSACSWPGHAADIRAGSLVIGLDRSGRVVSFTDTTADVEYLPHGQTVPLLSLRVDDRELEPVHASFELSDSILTLTCPGRREATVRVKSKPTHATFELLSVSDADAVDLAIWGPYPTSIGKTIGETVGVVRGETFAMGIQSLNPKTLGGYPWNENDAMPQLDIFESGDFSDLSEVGKRGVLYRVEAAKPDTFGSTLQAYTRNRTEARVVPNLGHERYLAPAFDDGGIVGSKIALFGSPVAEALATLGDIEVDEGLPHPTLNGRWTKESPSATAAYVILPFSESTVGRAVDVTLKAGLRYLYHGGPFKSWGHFELGEDFPNGIAGLREAVAYAESRGVHVGVHTLSNFISTNDPYVTPIPDPRLARVGSTELTNAIGPHETEFGIRSPDFFKDIDNSTLRSAVVGEEIIQYGAVSETPPWTLLDVERGAFGTQAAEHAAADPIGKLADHPYRVFLTDADLTREVATNLAELFNETGLRQISFDGLEGNRSTGMGNYGEILFTTSWFEALGQEVRSHFIADASRTSHYFWHIYTRMNWGEPWGAAFREGQTEYRMKNQAYFQRNMMPGMLGWFQMRPETSVEDIEWMLARSAAFNAGYAFVTSFETLEQNAAADDILSLLGLWEAARMAGAFSEEQRRRMEDLDKEFHLEEVAEGGWKLTQIHSTVFRLASRARQSGAPTPGRYTFQSPEGAQALRFILTAVGGSVSGIRLTVDEGSPAEFDIRLRDGERLVYEGAGRATVLSSRGQPRRSIPVDASLLQLRPGSHGLVVDASLEGYGEASEDLALKIEIRLWGEPEFVPQ